MRQLIAVLLCVMAWPAFGATCKISEYADLVDDGHGRVVAVAQEPSLTTQNVTYTTSTGSSAFNTATRFVRIVCDAKAHFKFSTTGTNAAATDPYLAADADRYFGVPKGGSYLVEFYDGSS